MIAYYKSLLTNHSSPLQPLILGDVLNKGSAKIELDFPDNISLELSKISNWLLSNLDEATVFTDLYGEVRARNLAQTLCDFYQYEQKSSSTTPMKRLTIKRQATASSLRKSFRKKSKRQSMSLNEAHPDNSQSLGDMRPFARRVQALQLLVNGELELMKSTLPIEYHAAVLDIIVAPALQAIGDEADKFGTQLDRALKFSDYGALLKLCPCVDQINRVSSSLMQTLHLASDHHRGLIGRFLREFESKAVELLDDFEDHIKSDTLTLPSDATVHQLNADTVHFIESVEPFYDSIGRIICKKDERTISTSEGYVNYKRDLLAALSMNLRNKATDFKSQSTRSLFLMNNFHFVKARLGQLYIQGDQKVLEESRLELAKEYKQMENESYEQYLQEWGRLQIIALADIPIQLNAPKLNDKEKTAIKEKFRKFNSTFEELITTNRSLTVTDGSQLQKIKDEIKKSVVTPYIDMIDKYGGRDFAKGNTSKYVKYSTEAITAEIEKIFDLSA